MASDLGANNPGLKAQILASEPPILASKPPILATWTFWIFACQLYHYIIVLYQKLWQKSILFQHSNLHSANTLRCIKIRTHDNTTSNQIKSIYFPDVDHEITLTMKPDEDQRTDRKFANTIFHRCHFVSNTFTMPQPQRSNFHSKVKTEIFRSSAIWLMITKTGAT